MRAVRASGGYAGSTRRRIWPASSLEIIALLAGRGGATGGKALPMPARIPFGMQLMVHCGSTLLGGATSLPGVMRRNSRGLSPYRLRHQHQRIRLARSYRVRWLRLSGAEDWRRRAWANDLR